MRYWPLLMILALSNHTEAEELKVEYSTFYSHLRKIDDDELNRLQFAFGFQHVSRGDLCHLDKALIHTQKIDIPVSIRADRRFSLPTEKALKMARAEVLIELQEPANQCDMSVQILTRSEFIHANMSVDDLTRLQNQFDTFFDDMGSFLSFLMPSSDGLLLQFDKAQQYSVLLDKKQTPELQIQDQQLIISRQWLASHQGELQFTPQPSKITAFVNQG